jgi:hypothetical protein
MIDSFAASFHRVYDSDYSKVLASWHELKCIELSKLWVILCLFFLDRSTCSFQQSLDLHLRVLSKRMQIDSRRAVMKWCRRT